MKVLLTPELENWVQEKVQNGVYESESEVVQNALRLLYSYEQKRSKGIEHLRSELMLGIEQLDQGMSRPFTKEVVDEIKNTGRKKLGKISK